jgi:hypothetical protein
MNNLVKIIKEETGLSIGDFCEKELKSKYTAFSFRMKNAKLYPAEVFYIVYRTRKPIEELFGASWKELLISSQGGEIAEIVRELIRGMNEVEKQEVLNLMGWAQPQLSVPAPEEKKEEQAPEENSDQPKEENPKKDPFENLFIKTY